MEGKGRASRVNLRIDIVAIKAENLFDRNLIIHGCKYLRHTEISMKSCCRNVIDI